MISTESVIDLLRDHHRDKLALTVLVGLMGGDDLTTSWSRLDELLPVMRKIRDQSRKGVRDRLPVDGDIARRVHEIAAEIEPWLRQVAEVS
jgi:hypothetical protein